MKKSNHIWRERKHSLGELVQLDGSKHIWFNNQYCTLIAFIDDATGRIMHAQFALEETIKDIALSTKAYFKQHGRSLKIYTDRGKVFKVNKGENKPKKRRKDSHHSQLRSNDTVNGSRDLVSLQRNTERATARTEKKRRKKMRSYKQLPSHPWRIWQETPKKGHFRLH